METYLAFIKAHEKLIIVLGLATFAFFLGNKLLATWDAHDQHNLSITQQRLAADNQQSSALSAQLATLQAQVSSLSTQRHAALAKQQTGDATLTPQAAAQKLGGQAEGDNVVLPIDLARSIASQLDELPVLRADLADQQKVMAQQTQVIASLNTTLADQANVCKAQVASLNAKHRRSVWKSIGYGIGAGFIAALLIK
jgi:hypothetical protein